MGLAVGVPDGVEVFVGEERQVLDALFWVIQRKRVDRLQFDATDARILHRAQFPADLRLGDGRAEPPPPHHHSRVIRRVLEEPLQLFDAAGFLGSHVR
jgi:hypothetical protein